MPQVQKLVETTLSSPPSEFETAVVSGTWTLSEMASGVRIMEFKTSGPSVTGSEVEITVSASSEVRSELSPTAISPAGMLHLGGSDSENGSNNLH